MSKKGNQELGFSQKRCAYLLRYWQEIDGQWRFMLEAVDGRVIPLKGFADQANLLTHLSTVLPNNDRFKLC